VVARTRLTVAADAIDGNAKKGGPMTEAEDSTLHQEIAWLRADLDQTRAQLHRLQAQMSQTRAWCASLEQQQAQLAAALEQHCTDRRMAARTAPDLTWLDTGLCVWFTDCVGAHPAVDGFPNPPGLEQARERLAELVCRVTDAAGDTRLGVQLVLAAERVAAAECESWLYLGLQVGAHLAAGGPLDAQTLAGYIEQTYAAVAAQQPEPALEAS
jgi:hypothetical protein